MDIALRSTEIAIEQLNKPLQMELFETPLTDLLTVLEKQDNVHFVNQAPKDAVVTIKTPPKESLLLGDF